MTGVAGLLTQELMPGPGGVKTLPLRHMGEPEPPVTWRLGLHESMAPIRRAAIKVGIAAFIAALFTQVLGIPSAGALFTTLAIGMEVTSGTTSFKPVLMIGGVALGFAVIVLVVKPWMPNLDDPGSLLLLAAVAFAPTAWMTIAGPRVRNGGVFGTVLVSIALFASIVEVPETEQAVVLRFGEYVRDAKPGANYHMPYPIETVLTPKVTRVNRIDIGIGNSGRTLDRLTCIVHSPERTKTRIVRDVLRHNV